MNTKTAVARGLIGLLIGAGAVFPVINNGLVYADEKPKAIPIQTYEQETQEKVEESNYNNNKHMLGKETSFLSEKGPMYYKTHDNKTVYCDKLDEKDKKNIEKFMFKWQSLTGYNPDNLTNPPDLDSYFKIFEEERYFEPFNWDKDWDKDKKMSDAELDILYCKYINSENYKALLKESKEIYNKIKDKHKPKFDEKDLAESIRIYIKNKNKIDSITDKCLYTYRDLQPGFFKDFINYYNAFDHYAQSG